MRTSNPDETKGLNKDVSYEVTNKSSQSTDMQYFQEAIQSPLLKSIALERPETEQERSCRLRMAEDDAKVKRIKDVVTFVVGILLAVVLFTACLYIIFDYNSSQEAKTWAMGAVMSIVGAIIGFITGKNAAAKT